MFACAHAQHDERGILGEELGNSVGHHFQLCAEHADFFQLFRVPPKRQRLAGGLANGAPAGPRDVGWDQSDVTDHGDMVVAKSLLNVEGSSTIERVPSQPGKIKGGAQIVFRCSKGAAVKTAPPTVGQPHLHKAIASGLTHLGIKEADLDRKHVNARRVRRGRLIGSCDEEHRNLFAVLLHLADVFDVRTIVVHAQAFLPDCGEQRSSDILGLTGASFPDNAAAEFPPPVTR